MGEWMHVLRDEFVSVMQSKTGEELFSQVVQFTRQLGFDLATVLVAIDHVDADTEFLNMHNAAPAYGEYSEDRISARRNPVMQHLKHRSVPIAWSRDDFARVGLGHQWERGAAFGFHGGIALAMHLPGGRHFIVSGSRDQPLPKGASGREELSRMAADLQLFAVHAHEAALRVLAPAAREDPAALPSSRELECLRWTMEGKTAWEVGRILGISEHTAARHVNNATRKLACVNKHHAVMKALRMGLIA